MGVENGSPPKRKLAAVALANKTARVAWAMLAKGEDYRAPAAVALQAASGLPGQGQGRGRHKLGQGAKMVLTTNWLRRPGPRDSCIRHRDIDHVGLVLQLGFANFIRASGSCNNRTKQAVYITAPEDPRPHISKPLANRGPSIHDGCQGMAISGHQIAPCRIGPLD